MHHHLNFTTFALDTSSDVTDTRSSQPQCIPSSYSHSREVLLYSGPSLFEPFLILKILDTSSHICGLAICIIVFHPILIFLFLKNELGNELWPYLLTKKLETVFVLDSVKKSFSYLPSAMSTCK